MNAYMSRHSIAVAAVAVLLHGPALAEPKAPVANAGSLTCVVAAGTSVGKSRALSCTFVRTAGPNAQFSGSVKSFGKVANGAKIVLAWSVLAPTADIDAVRLAGRYVGALGSATGGKTAEVPKTGGLVGGMNNQIRLVPLGIAPTVGMNVAHSILDLELTMMKA